jgi:hypothetical protein
LDTFLKRNFASFCLLNSLLKRNFRIDFLLNSLLKRNFGINFLLNKFLMRNFCINFVTEYIFEAKLSKMKNFNYNVLKIKLLNNLLQTQNNFWLTCLFFLESFLCLNCSHVRKSLNTQFELNISLVMRQNMKKI